jgi:hypothetical protein
MNIVLFLGAGFSAAFDLPVMNDFLSFADSSQKLSDEEKGFIGRIVLDARRANSFLQSSPTNLEDILSFSVMADRLSRNGNSPESQNYKIKSILQKLFTQVVTVNNFWERYDSFKTFLSCDPRDNSKYNLSIVTTNYDLSIECALTRQQLKTNPGFMMIQDEVNSNRLQVRNNFYTNNYGIPVYKLHGSVNWFEIADNENSFTVEGRIVAVVGNFEDHGEKSLPYACVKEYVNPTPPIIVPPSFLKPDLSGPLSDIWKGASEKLRTANILVFIGYSFPLTDTDMMYFLASSLTDNPGLRKILIIDPLGNEILSKINSSQSKFGSHFKDLIEIRNTKWQETTLKPYL